MNSDIYPPYPDISRLFESHITYSFAPVVFVYSTSLFNSITQKSASNKCHINRHIGRNYCKHGTKDRTCGGKAENNHPTVKNRELMKWLCRLVTPPGGTVLDCFAGSGSTAIACLEEGFRYILIEQDAESVKTANDRVSAICSIKVESIEPHATG